ncbi:MAG: DUF4410 domain-containing protein [Alphaproteobacteria bacterium]|nr:DUF4410 domain-containing protein [Alphaproteobacteria bacterium]
MRILKSIFVLVLAAAISACASGATTVLSPPTIATTAAYKTLKIESGTDTVSIPADARAHFETRLNEYLLTAKPPTKFTPGSDLTLRYRFIQFDEGSRALRYLVGLGAGKGKMTAEVVFLDAQSKEVAKIHVEGEISMGFFGGDFDMAISQAARQVADYTVKSF